METDVAMLLEAAGVDRILAVDLHSAQIQGQFQHCPVDNLSMFEDFAEYFVDNILSKFTCKEEIAIVSPDADGTARAKFFVGLLQDKAVDNVSLAITIRQKTDNNISVNLIGDIQDKHCVVIDDIIDTGHPASSLSLPLFLSLPRRSYRIEW
jgi:ribose-phosphate pyrophosphokinase